VTALKNSTPAFGAVNSTYTLSVPQPSAITNKPMFVTSPGKSILLRFTAPASDGGFPIINYEYSVVASGGTARFVGRDDFGVGVSNTSTLIEITKTSDSVPKDIIRGATYSVCIRAVTGFNTKSVSSSSSPVTIVITA
jgi:hypothetical protein